MRALVAGGAGGIGRQIVQNMVNDGYRVTIADVDAQRANEVARATGASGFVVADLSTDDGARLAVEAATAGETLHALVNTQGISPKKDGKMRPFYEIDLEEWNRVLAVNLTGPFLLVKHAYHQFVRDGSASVVNIVSITAKTGAAGPAGSTFGPFSPSAAHYAASKAALKNLTASVSRELAPLGIRCNAVSPGYLGGGMAGSTASDLDAIMRPQIPLGRAATAQDVAGVVSFLLSGAAHYITGETIDVDGGWIPD